MVSSQLHTPAALRRYPLNTRLGGPQSRFWPGGKIPVKNPAAAKIRTPVVQPIACKPTDWVTPMEKMAKWGASQLELSIKIC